jgi:phage terminase large subunit GpA-like protein
MPSLLLSAAPNIAPPTRLKPSEWAEERFYLSSESSSEPGRISFSRAPYQREMLDAIEDPAVEEVCIMSSSQVGKTSVQLMLVGYLIDMKPGPILWVAPTLQMAEATSKDRIAPMIRDCPTLSEKIKSPQARNSNNTLLQKGFAGGFIVLAGANSPASLASRPIQALFGDEVDRYPDSAGTEGSPINLAKKRTTTFWNRLHIWVSTPTIKDRSNIEKIWLLSDRREYELPCPHCGGFQALKWEGLKYKDKGSVNLQKFDIEDVRYECSHCGGEIEEHQKLEMLKAGQWTPRGRKGKIAGFHLNELYSPWKSWEDVARDYEAAIGDPLRLQVFWNTSLGLPYEHDLQTKFDWENLQYRAEASNYQMGQIPEGVLLLTAGVDVQGDRIECSVFGWGEGEQSWLIRHDVLYGDPNRDGVWQDLDALLSTEFHHPLGGVIKIKKAAVDSGYLTQEVYGRSRGKREWMVVKGKEGDRKIVAPATWQETNWQGRTIKKGVKLHLLGVDLIKQTLLGRCRIPQPSPKYLNLPVNVPPKYCQELAGSEVLVKKKKSSQWVYVWEAVPGVRNEPLDCAVYAYAAAVFVGLNRFNAAQWEKLRALVTVTDATPEPTPEPDLNLPVPEPKKPRTGRKPKRRGGYLSGYGKGV